MELPIVVKMDNIDALVISKNASTGVQTHHINIHFLFIQEMRRAKS